MIRYYLLILSLLAIFAKPSFGQKPKTYEGAFQNGIPAKGMARYSYYLDKRGNKIKQGSFRYLVKEKTHEYRLTHNFQGEYDKGLKNGVWEYTVKSKDYGSDEQGYATSSEIVLKASYKHGIPEGRWTYSALISKRKKIKTKDGKGDKWTEPKIVKDVNIIVNFKDGVLVDSLKIEDRLKGTIDILCDDKGMLDGDFVIKLNGKNVVYKFKEGFSASKPDGSAVSDYEYFLKTKSNPKKGYVTDTLSFFANKNCLVAKYLNDNVFNNDYFLYNYIEGDKIFTRNGRGRILSVNYKGLYYKRLKAVMSKEESKLVDDIWYYENEVRTIENKLKYSLKKMPSNKSLKQSLERVGQLHKEIKSYTCIAAACKEFVKPDEIKLKAEKKCGKSYILNKGVSSKEELLEKLVKASKSAYDKAAKLSL